MFEKNIPYSNTQLETLLKGVLNVKKLKIYELDDFYKRSISKMFGSNQFMVIYLSNEGSDIGHWITMLHIDDKTVEIFNSLGKDSHDIKPIRSILKRQGYKVIENEQQLQSNTSNYCGRFVVLRILSRHSSLQQFQAIFNQSTLSPDQIVETLVAIESKR